MKLLKYNTGLTLLVPASSHRPLVCPAFACVEWGLTLEKHVPDEFPAWEDEVLLHQTDDCSLCRCRQSSSSSTCFRRCRHCCSLSSLYHCRLPLSVWKKEKRTTWWVVIVILPKTVGMKFSQHLLLSLFHSLSSWSLVTIIHKRSVGIRLSMYSLREHAVVAAVVSNRHHCQTKERYWIACISAVRKSSPKLWRKSAVERKISRTETSQPSYQNAVEIYISSVKKSKSNA